MKDINRVAPDIIESIEWCEWNCGVMDVKQELEEESGHLTITLVVATDWRRYEDVLDQDQGSAG